MCIRFDAATRVEIYDPEQKVWIVLLNGAPPTDSLFPGRLGPIARLSAEGHPEMVSAEWGLMPWWAKERKFGKTKAYNARAETVFEKPTFRDAIRERRCLVPATGFYERDEAMTSWFRFHTPDDTPLLFAGLYDKPTKLVDTETFCFVTTEPNLRVMELQDRMPVLLDREAAELWMTPDANLNDLRALMTPAPEECLIYEFAEPVQRGPRKVPTLPIDA